MTAAAPEVYSRVSRSHGALYSSPRTCAKRRRCDGHLAERHWIEVGDPIIWSALPPYDNDIGNPGWWHLAFCHLCAPVEHIGTDQNGCLCEKCIKDREVRP